MAGNGKLTWRARPGVLAGWPGLPDDAAAPPIASSLWRSRRSATPPGSASVVWPGVADRPAWQCAAGGTRMGTNRDSADRARVRCLAQVGAALRAARHSVGRCCRTPRRRRVLRAVQHTRYGSAGGIDPRTVYVLSNSIKAPRQEVDILDRGFPFGSKLVRNIPSVEEGAVRRGVRWSWL